VIAELASLLNRLPGMLPTAFSCPAMAAAPARVPSPYRVVFTPQSRRWPTIVAAPVGCWDGGQPWTSPVTRSSLRCSHSWASGPTNQVELIAPVAPSGTPPRTPTPASTAPCH
jgi:hypothetical protein